MKMNVNFLLALFLVFCASCSAQSQPGRVQARYFQVLTNNVANYTDFHIQTRQYSFKNGQIFDFFELFFSYPALPISFANMAAASPKWLSSPIHLTLTSSPVTVSFSFGTELDYEVITYGPSGRKIVGTYKLTEN